MKGGKVTSAATEVALTETETDAVSGLAGYSAYQPPNQAATDVRAEVTATGNRVVALLGEVRIDARAGRWDDASAASDDLVALSQRLHDLQRQIAP